MFEVFIMFTLQDLQMKTECMMEQIRRNAIDTTIEEFKEAVKRYYTNGYDNGETIKLVKELEELGVYMEVIFDIDWNIREEVEISKKMIEG